MWPRLAAGSVADTGYCIIAHLKDHTESGKEEFYNFSYRMYMYFILNLFAGLVDVLAFMCFLLSLILPWRWKPVIKDIRSRFESKSHQYYCWSAAFKAGFISLIDIPVLLIGILSWAFPHRWRSNVLVSKEAWNEDEYYHVGLRVAWASNTFYGLVDIALLPCFLMASFPPPSVQ